MSPARARKPWRIKVGNDQTSAVVDVAGVGGVDDVFVCAHGAGGNMSDRSMLALPQALSARGLNVVRFNFFYSEKESGRPDRMPKLIECYAAVVERVRKELAPTKLFLAAPWEAARRP